MMVELARDGDVFVLTLGGGENRIDGSFVDEWNARIDEVGASTGPAALVTAGTGKFFSYGLDLDWLTAQAPEDANLFFRDLFASWARILTLPMVSVAAVNGHAFGAGALLTLAHHRRVMRTDRGWWCMPEADHGWVLQPAMIALLRARLPAVTAHEAVLLARRFTGPEALAAGVVNATADESHVIEAAVAEAAAHADKRSDALSTLAHDLYAETVDTLTSERGIAY